MYKLQNIIFPDSVSVSQNSDGNVTMMLRAGNVVKNMQTNEACFDAWALVIKANFYNVSSVHLIFDKPDFNILTSIERQHYLRFLFRLFKFGELFDWFSCNHKIEDLFASADFSFSTKYLVNKPTNFREQRSPVIPDIKLCSEDVIENIIIADDVVNDRFKSLFGLDNLDRQFPVGLFKSEGVIRINRVFTGGKSAIDLWGYKSGNKDFHVFELKKYKNISVGMLSELLFYVFFRFVYLLLCFKLLFVC